MQKLLTSPCKTVIVVIEQLGQKGDDIVIQHDYRDPRPVYEQIKEKIKELILAKVLKAEDKIFSVREMSSYLTINPNTILKAYKELENEGYIYSIKGKGYFVADRKSVAEVVDKAPIYAKVEESLKELYYLGESKEAANEIINKIWGTQ